MSFRLLTAALAAAALLVPSPASAKKQSREDAAAWLLPSSTEAPSAASLAKRFPGAPAVIVLDAAQHEWVTDRQRTTLQRRVRLVTGQGAREHARVELFLPETAGPWKPIEGSARLISSSGSVKQTASPRTEAVDGGRRISAELPGAEAGDLVELLQTLEAATPSYPPWTAQAELPVLESRVVTVPPPLVTLRAYGASLPEGALEPTEFSHGELKAAGWRFESLPPLRATGPFLPPREAVASRMWLAIERVPDLASGQVLELDWPTWSRLASQAVATWAEPELAASLAAELGGAASPASVADALRRKLRVTRTAAWPDSASARAALQAGSGNSADLALLAAAVLRAGGAEDVEVVAVRARARGPVAAVAPVDGNFTELLVRAGGRWIDPAPRGGVGELPARFRGTLAAPLKAGLAAPEPLPPPRADDNRIERRARLTLAPEGGLRGTSNWTWSPLAAALAGAESSELEREVDRAAWGARAGKSLEYGVLPWRILQQVELAGAPPEGLLDLGWPRVVVDRIVVELPAGVTGAKLAAPAKIDAGPAGSYERTVEPEGRTVTVTRTFRLELTRFGPEEAPALFEWLRRIQQAERATTKLQLK